MIDLFNAIPARFLTGIPVLLVCGLSLVCSSYDWYWEEIASGYWKRWNTPAGRAWTKLWSVVGLVGGTAMVFDLLPPSL